MEAKEKLEKDSPSSSTPEVYDFKCSMCDLHEKAEYKGTAPPFSRNIILKYPSYVMRDPFSPPGKGEILVLGADCTMCEKPVCVAKECSLFYLKSYCLECVEKNNEQFPSEIKAKLAQANKKR